MRRADLTRCESIVAHDHLIHSECRNDCSGSYQYAELGYERSVKRHHLSRDIHIHVAIRFDDGKPGGSHHLYAHCNQQRRLGNSIRDRNGKCSR